MKYIPKNEIYSQCYEFGTQSRSSFVNHKYGIGNCWSWLEIKNLARFGPKVVMCLIFMKFGTQNKSNMLIMNILANKC